jgi:hypothetical protein
MEIVFMENREEPLELSIADIKKDSKGWSALSKTPTFADLIRLHKEGKLNLDELEEDTNGI